MSIDSCVYPIIFTEKIILFIGIRRVHMNLFDDVLSYDLCCLPQFIWSEKEACKISLI